MKIKGVNLGNWLVLEKWMSPALFDGTEAEDETWLARKCKPAEYEVRMRIHREYYITERDFAIIAANGLNMVRIPVPYFIFGDRDPFIRCVEYLDKAFDWAEKFGLQILIDLHTAPGSQNGFDNGGLTGVCKFGQEPEEVEYVLDVLEKLAQRYGKRQGLWGIEILNEPVSDALWNTLKSIRHYPPVDEQEAEGSGGIPSSFLRDFYVKAYRKIRKYADASKAVVIHEGFRFQEWKDFMREEEFQNVYLDVHIYLMMQMPMDTVEAYDKFFEEKAAEIADMQRYFPVIVGEWCIENPLSTKLAEQQKAGEFEGTGEEFDKAQKEIYRKIAEGYDKIFQACEGSFFWSYKLHLDTEKQPGKDSWDMERCFVNKWL